MADMNCDDNYVRTRISLGMIDCIEMLPVDIAVLTISGLSAR